MRVSAAILFFLIVLASGPAAAQALVYRVDQATAFKDGQYLVVHVKGAARSGGWENPRLVVRRSNKKNIEVQFVATPPEDAEAVVQSLVPMHATLKTRAPGKTVGAVKIVSETNSVTARIVGQRRQHTARQEAQAASATTRFRPLFFAR
jgi:hypothetical protein